MNLRKLCRLCKLLCPETPRPVAWFYIDIPQELPMPKTTAADLLVGKVRAFSLVPVLPAGASPFVEPTIDVSPATAGTVSLMPSTAGVADASGNTTYTTPCVFTPAAGYTGPVTLSADIGAVDNADLVFNIITPPPAETVGFDLTSIVDSDAPAPDPTAAATTQQQVAAGQAAVS